MIGNYLIYIINSFGHIRNSLTEFKSLHFIDIHNESGSWTLSGASHMTPDFQPGDSICVFRNSRMIYGGVLINLTEEYDFATDSYKWQATGAGFNELLKWRVVYPSGKSSGKFTSRWLYLPNVSANMSIEKLIIDNLTLSGAEVISRDIPGYDIVKGVQIVPGITALINEKCRFESVFDTVMDIANIGHHTVMPVYDMTAEGVIFYIYSATDVSNRVVFSDVIGNIKSFKRIIASPETTHIIASYNSDQTGGYAGTEMWKYASAAVIPSTYSKNFLTREMLVKPEADEFNNSFNPATLSSLADRYANEKAVTTEGYEVELSMDDDTFTYGYDNTNSDYKLGDTISICVKGTEYKAQLTKMEISVAYGKETISASLGNVTKGKFASIISALKNNSANLSKYNNKEIA